MIGNLIAESAFELKRLGKFTASRIDDLFTEPREKAAKERGELSKSASDYILEKVSEITTGYVRGFENAATEWGNMYEPEAAGKLKEFYPDLNYWGGEKHEFFQYSPFAGGSPDCATENTVFEIKCPENPKNHIQYCLLNTGEDLKRVERGYYHQIQMNMACLSNAYKIPFEDMRGQFVSYCPIIQKGYKELHRIDILPETGFIEKLDKILDCATFYMAEILDKMKI